MIMMIVKISSLYHHHISIEQFRTFLEKQNIQFDDVQCLALFAYFDDDNDG